MPGGTVTFKSGTLTISAPLNEDGWVTVSTQALPLGANSVTATYGGDAHYGGSSATLVELVSAPTAVPTRVELVGVPSTTIIGAPIWLTVDVIPDVWVAAGVPTGTVTVHLTDAQGNKSTLFSGSLPAAGWVTFTTTSLPMGGSTLTATYSGDANYAASASAPISQQVGPAPGKIATSVALVAAPTVTMAGEPIWLTASVTPAEWTFGTPVGTVTFTGGNVTLTGTLSIGDWVTLATSAIAQGTNTITATYNGDAHYASSSATTMVTVNSLGIGTTSAMISWNNPSAFGDAVAISVNVMPGQWGYGWPTGTVTLTGGGLTLTDTLTNGWTVFVTSALPPGNHAMTATYGGSSIFGPSAATITQTVQPR